MSLSLTDYEVSFNGKTFLTVDKGQINVQGIDMQTDLVNISRLISILSDVLDSALTAQAEPCLRPITPLYVIHKERVA